MTKTFAKDRWIKHAILHGYLKAQIDGRIMRCARADKTGKLLTEEYAEVKVQVHKATGRVYFNMSWMGFTKSVLVNRVIALAFLPNPLNLPQVNHIDGNKENNALYQADGSPQLEWSTGQDNEKHAHRTGLKTGRGSSNANAKLTSADAMTIRQSDLPITELMERYGVARSTIANIKAGKTWLHL